MATKDVKDVKDETAASSESKLFTRAEVAKHTDPKDTWIIIHNNVYNVTSFLNEVQFFLFSPNNRVDHIISTDCLHQSLLVNFEYARC